MYLGLYKEILPDIDSNESSEFGSAVDDFCNLGSEDESGTTHNKSSNMIGSGLIQNLN